MSEERITNLEIRYSHQDEFLAQLNQIVIDQQKTIERLEKEILDIKRTLNSFPGEDRLLKNERPPHY
jgi:SlyX protein